MSLTRIPSDILNRILDYLKGGTSLRGFAHGPQQVQAEDATSVTPSNATILPLTSGLFVGSDGNVNVEFGNGNTVVFQSLVAGTILPVRVVKVLSTSTTATNIIALY